MKLSLIVATVAAVILTACEGPQGPSGTDGQEGLQGPRGDVGAQGATGAQGDAGSSAEASLEAAAGQSPYVTTYGKQEPGPVVYLECPAGGVAISGGCETGGPTGVGPGISSSASMGGSAHEGPIGWLCRSGSEEPITVTVNCLFGSDWR